MLINPLTVGFFLLGSIGVLASLPKLLKATKSTSWPSTSGKVLESTLDISRGNKLSDKTILPHLLYEYEVGGKKYTSNKIHILRGWTENEAVLYPDRYPKDSLIIVFYNPRNPAEAVIEKGFHHTGFLGLYVSAIFMFMGAYWMFM